LEIEPRRVAEIAVGRAGVAIDAAMLTPAVRVDRAVEADIGAVVRGDDAARRLDAHLGFESLELGQALPPVVELLASFKFVAPDAIGPRTTATATVGIDQRTGSRTSGAVG